MSHHFVLCLCLQNEVAGCEAKLACAASWVQPGLCFCSVIDLSQ